MVSVFQGLLLLRMNGKEIGDDELVSLAMDGYHFNSIGDFLDIQPDEIEKNSKPLEVATNVVNVLQEFLSSHDHLEIDGEQRLVIHG